MTAVAVVLESDLTLPVPDVGAEIARALGRPLADVTRALRRSRGIVALDLVEKDAREVARILEARGTRCRLVPEEDLPELPDPTALTDADPEPAGLRIQAAGQGAPHHVPWSRIEILAVGLVTFRIEPPPSPITSPEEADLEDYVRGWGVGSVGTWGIPRDDRAARMKRKAKEKTVHALDLVTGVPTDRYRIVASQFVYDYLGERLALTSLENFRTLVLDIANLAPETLLTGSTLSYLDGARPGSHRFRTPQEFDGYVRWVHVWRQVWG
ncbi:MAG: hypothetical protein ACYS99_01930 [Planctomycetota bacterium]